MLLLLAGFFAFDAAVVSDGAYLDTYAVEVLPGDEATLRGVDIAVEGGTVVDTAGPSSIFGTGTDAQDIVKTQPTIDKIAA